MLRLLAALIFLTSCATNQQLSPDTLYRWDMDIKVDGQRSQLSGVHIVPRKNAYQIEAKFYKKAEKFVARSCHRDWDWQKPGWSEKFTYRPDPIFERSRDEFCDLELAAFDEKGQHSWGYITFQDDESLPATIGCNGFVRSARGVSFCQARAGLLQRISFDRVTKAYSVKRCPPMETKDNLTFTYQMARGKCLYLFTQGDSSHRMMSYGYDDTIMR